MQISINLIIEIFSPQYQNSPDTCLQICKLLENIPENLLPYFFKGKLSKEFLHNINEFIGKTDNVKLYDIKNIIQIIFQKRFCQFDLDEFLLEMKEKQLTEYGKITGLCLDALQDHIKLNNLNQILAIIGKFFN